MLEGLYSEDGGVEVTTKDGEKDKVDAPSRSVDDDIVWLACRYGC